MPDRKKILILLLLVAAFLIAGCGTTKYKVDYHGQKSAFKGAKSAYEEGEEVCLRYDSVATDTDYTFYVDGKKTYAYWNDGAYELWFYMPAHDIEVYVEKTSGMAAVQSLSADISDFSYSYNNSYGMCGYTYNLSTEADGSVLFSYTTDVHMDYEEMTMTLETSVMDQIRQLILNYQVYKWDGFNLVDEDILDGDGFYLGIYFQDDTRIRASGSNAVPSGYRDFVSALDELLNPYAEQLCEEKRQEIISRGSDGTLDFIMVTINQQGESGSDKYSFHLRQSETGKNFDVSIKSASGEYLPKGDYRYYCNLDSSLIPFAEVQDLYEDLNMISWYDYDKAAEDYSNSEWFQIDFGFDNDFYLEAMGTEHPEHYEEFRERFLTLMIDCIQKNEQEGNISLYE